MSRELTHIYFHAKICIVDSGGTSKRAETRQVQVDKNNGHLWPGTFGSFMVDQFTNKR